MFIARAVSLLGLLLFAGAGAATGAPPERDEDAIFGADDGSFGDPEPDPDDTKPDPADAADADADARGGFGAEDAERRFSDNPANFDLQEDPLTIGGQLYLRFGTRFMDGVAAGDAPLAMPNLLDLYLDARPVERVRGFFSGRLNYDPTVSADDTGFFGQPVEAASVLVNQLWIKTDIARSVFLTVGQERIKWGASRLWNPTDFINSTRREPLAIFDERVGVPMVKVHVPIESLGWNVYGIVLLDSVSLLKDIGGALRLEAVVGPAEITASAVFGRGRATSLGLDFSTPLGPIDVYGELGIIDARDYQVWSGELDIGAGKIPTATARGSWAALVSGGLSYEFKPNDEDIMIVGAEYFYNPLGYKDPAIYGWLLAVDQLQPFYFGQHYASLFWLIPSPGSWNNSSFTLSNVGNLSDRSFLTRLDFFQTLHRRLRLEVYVQVHYGKSGGEFRFTLDVPDLPAMPPQLPDPIEAFTIPAPRVLLGINLRIAL